ncbi:integral membrane protein GPR155-like protein [Sarcoptes scabiei]|uniref:Integral membrane protein GPR155-like protein n=1 Tax=Sarcoptes scabiei TaxID=52283 RepID=A0A132ABB3_SARSC|nr:integral membrane protein GPR155-like protein [Sarcoptes scabiei]
MFLSNSMFSIDLDRNASTHNNTSFGIIDVVAVNIQCFGLIIFGYFASAFNLINANQVNSLNSFLSYFALPSLVFYSMSTLPLLQVNLGFIEKILISKSLLFVFVGAMTFILSWRSMRISEALSRCSIFSMFCTQSNDFALGYPILLSLYGNSQDSFANYIYILAPIQLLILNPFGLFLIELSQILEENNMHQSQMDRLLRLIPRIIYKIVVNPIILFTLVGLIVNLITGAQLPPVIEPLLQNLSQTFSPIALFSLGLNIHGNLRSLKMFSQPLLITLILVSIKSFIMPLLNLTIVQYINIDENSTYNETFSQFAFLYGTFPAAPTVYIFSNIYQIETLIVSAGLVLSTLLSAPMIFVSTNMIRFSEQIDYKLLNDDLVKTIVFSSLISVLGTLMLISSFVVSKKFHSITHQWSWKILFSHLIISIAGILFQFNSISNDQSETKLATTISVIQYYLFNLGFFALKIYVSFLSLMICLLYSKSLCFVIRFSAKLFYASLFSFIIFIVFLMLTDLDNFRLTNRFLIDLYYGTNKIHIVTCGESCRTQCHTVVKNCSDRLIRYRQTIETAIEAITIVENRSDEEEELTLDVLKQPKNYHQVQHHLYLIMYSILLILIHLSIEINHLIQEESNGIYIEIKFLDISLVFTYGFLMFLLFGFDTVILRYKIKKFLKSFRFDEIYLPPIDQLNLETMEFCDNFKQNYLIQCKSELAAEKVHLDPLPGSVSNQMHFSGRQLVDWLLKNQLASTRDEAAILGNRLLFGRIIEHITKHHLFFDNTFYYKFN